MTNIKKIFKFNDLVLGSFFSLSGKILSVIFSLGAAMVISNYFGASVLGKVSFFTSFLTFTALLTNIGVNTLILKSFGISQNKDELLNYFSDAIYLIFSVSVSIILFLILNKKIGFDFFIPKWVGNGLFLILLLTIPFRGLQEFFQFSIRGLQNFKLFSIFQFSSNFANLILVVIFISISSNSTLPILALFFSYIITSIFSFGITMHKFFKNKKLNPYSFNRIKRIFIESFPFFIISISGTIISNSDILILGYFYDPQIIGVYAIAIKIALTISIISNSINAYVAPNISKLYTSGKFNELKDFLSQSTSLNFLITLPLFIIMIIYGDKLVLVLFGNEFSSSYLPMVIILIGQIFNSLSGPVATYLNMTGRGNIVQKVMSFVAILHLILSFLSIYYFGLVGAAVISSFSMILWNLTLVFYIKKNDNILLIFGFVKSNP